MEYRKLGRFGVKVSPICLGTAFRAFWNGLSDEKTCIRVIETAVDHGVNFIDCANSYFAGKCETVLGKALKGMKGKRDDLIITTKVWSGVGEGPNDHGLSRFHILREVDRSLKRLQLDYIDLYLLHNIDQGTGLDETLGAMDDVVRQGKARYIGCCNYTAAQVVESLWFSDKNGWAQVTCLQNQYNLFHRWPIEAELMPRSRQHGLGMMTYSPLAIGLLSGHLRRGQTPTDAVWGHDQARFKKALTKERDEVIQTLIDVAGELGKTPAQVAFAWILDHPEITSAITGPDLPEHVAEVCGAVGWSLPPELRKRLDDVSTPTLPGSPT